jgi:cyclic pyranopterin phosphate synthase
MAAKKVDSLIPLCHPLAVTKITIDFVYRDQERQIVIEATVGITGKTGVEMEALTAVSVTALTIYDMCKAVDKAMIISDICLQKKTGGKSGTFVRQE